MTTVGFTYSPACIKVKVGTTVKLTQSSFHPLRGMTMHGTTPNPIHDAETPPAMATTISVKMTDVGAYGFYCGNHGLDGAPGACGMAGAVYVVP